MREDTTDARKDGRVTSSVPPSFSSPPLSERPFSPAALGTPSDPELLARVWDRLEKSLPVGETRSAAQRRRLQWVSAAAVFVMGVLVGRWGAPLEPGTAANPEVSSEGVVLSGQQTAHPDPHAEDASELTDQTSRSVRGRNGRSSPVRRAPRRTSPVAPAPEGQSEEGLAAPDLPELLEPEPAPPETNPAPERAPWLVLAERGDFAAAFAELDHDGTFQAVLDASSAEELMTLADVARFAGRQGRAILALRQVTERYREDPNAPLAAMMLGNLLSRAGDRDGARAAYALNRALSPDGDFAEDALVRELDLVLASRDLTRALELLQKYQKLYPSGSRLPSLVTKVDALAEELAAEASPDATEETQDDEAERDRTDQDRAEPAEGDRSTVGDEESGGRPQGLDDSLRNLPPAHEPAPDTGDRSRPSPPYLDDAHD